MESHILVERAVLVHAKFQIKSIKISTSWVRLMNSSFMPDFSVSLKKFPLPGPSGNNLAGEGGGMLGTNYARM